MELPVSILKILFFFTLCCVAGSWSLTSAEFSSGDYVQILSDEELVTELHSHGIGFNSDMKPTLGKIGKVQYIDSDGDLKVEICDTTWFYSAKAVTKLAPAGDSGPQLSTDCEHTDTVLFVNQIRDGDGLKLECTVHDMPLFSRVRWVKDGEHIFNASINKGSYSSVTEHTYQIEDVKPEDAGWYVCEVIEDGKLIATGALEVKVDQEDTEIVKGDLVRITLDEDLIRELHSHGIGYVGGMKKTLGKIGRVKFIDDDGDLNVAICGTTWYYSVKAVTKITTSGTSTPSISADCDRQTIVNVKQRRFGDNLKLECTGDEILSSSSIHWAKDGVPIPSIYASKGSHSRFTVSRDLDDSEIFTLEIEDIVPEDAGMYTCEVRDDDVLIGTGAVEVKIDQESTEIAKGDLVQITLDEDSIRELHSHGIGYVGGMEKTLGKIGRVQFIDDDGDLNVAICTDTWYYSAKAVTKLTSAGSSAPAVSSDCVRSNAIVTVSQERVGRSVKLECSVDNQPERSSLRWMKGDEPTTNSLTVRSDDSCTLKVLDVKPEDAGWYACELRNDDGELAAVRAVQLVKKESVESFESGDLVQITFDEDFIEALHSHGIGFPHSMKPTLGKIGKVRYIDSDGDLNVAICDDTWFYSAKAVTKLSSAGTNTPKISADCVRSETTVTIRQEKVGSSVKMSCEVNNKPRGSYVRWIKGSDDVSTDDKVDTQYPRIKVVPHGTTDIVEIKIDNLKSEDAGWYTCEVRTDDKLYATGAVELEVKKEDATESTTEPDDGKLEEGDVVQVLSDKDTVEALEDDHGGWTGGMEPALGKIGIISENRDSGDIQVKVCGDTWVYNPKAVVKIASSSSRRKPSISKDCVYTDATISIKQERRGSAVKLECTVNNKPGGSFDVKWLKEDVEIIPNHLRVRTEGSAYTESIVIDKTEPEYAGWYTCELRNHEGLAATGTVKVTEETEETYLEPETTPTPGGEFEEGDLVQVLSDEDRVKEIHEVRVGFVEDMQKTLGKIGKVLRIDSDKDLYVEICGDTWYYNPLAVIKLASAGSSTFKISSECAYSKATIDFQQTIIRNSLILKCTVNHKDERSDLRLVKGERVIFSEHSYGRPEFDVSRRSEGSSKIFTLKIHDVKPDDLSWYTCELVNSDGNEVAIGVVRVENTSSPYPETETTPAPGGEFEKGDVVQVLSDEDRVKELHEGRVGFVEDMQKTLGKIGKVLRIDGDKDLYVEICGETWYYHPEAVIKLASAGSGTPIKSTDCVSSDATVSIKRRRVGSDMILDCTVVNKPYDSHVLWVNKDGRITQDEIMTMWKPRLSVTLDSSRTFRLKISDVKSQDGGWYACEVRSDGLAATAVVKVEVGETRTSIGETKTKPDVAEEVFKKGDVVQVLSDEATVRERFGSLYFNDDMRKTLGKIGQLSYITDNGNLNLEICGTSWSYNPRTVIKIASAVDRAPETSSDCTRSDARVSVEQTRVGNDVNLACTVVNRPHDSHVFWVNKDGRISKDDDLTVWRPRLSVSSDFSNTFTLKISDVKSHDAGWYACEVRNDGLAATAVVKVEAGEERSWPGDTTEIEVFHPETETEPTEEKFRVGDVVQVLLDEATVKRRFGSLNFPDEMRETLGKIGRVIRQDSVKDVYTKICGTEWWYKPNTLIKLASAGSSSAPEISSDCARSDSTVSISEQRSGDRVTLTCAVLHKPDDSRVSWIKDGTRISRDSVREIDDSRITVHSDFSSKKFIVQIDNVKPKDAGWYTCELTKDSEVTATAAAKLEVRQLPTMMNTTTEATVTDEKFAEGDLVWVLSDMEKVKELAEGHGGWNDDMKESLGKIGRVSTVFHDEDLSVVVCNTSWVYNPKALIKITSAGDSAPEISSNCAASHSTVTITQERVGNVQKLKCTVLNEPVLPFYVSWAKEGEEISRDNLLQTSNPRIKTRTDYSPLSRTLEIANMKPEDAGWYTCEVRHGDDELAAVRAVQLLYQPHDGPTAPASCVDCAALTAVEEELQDIKYLITNSTSELRSKLNDVSERLEMVEHRFFTHVEDAPAAV